MGEICCQVKLSFEPSKSLGGGLYVLIKRDQSQYTFQDSSNSGVAQLVQITRPQGQKTTITYSGNNQAVTDTITGQQLQMSYTTGRWYQQVIRSE